MNNIDVRGLPEPLARALESMVQLMRQQFQTEKQTPPRKVELPKWPGKVTGSLRRENLYADV